MKKMLLILLIPLMSLSAFDYEGYPDWENFISADFVRDIDSSGDSLWVTTNGGLASFDNYEWNFYNKSNSGIAGNRMYNFAFDIDDNLWITHFHGLSFFNRNLSDIPDDYNNITLFDLINYPNPFSTSTNISYELEQAGFVSIQVFDSFGKEVALLVNKTMQAGSHITEFDANGLSSGMYYYTIHANGKTESGKLVVVK